MHRSTIRHALLVVAALLLPTLCRAQTKPATAIATDYAWSGDDGLTMRFRASLERALASSQEFDVTRRGRGETLRLEIPTHVYAAEAEGRLNFHYVVIFTNQDSRYLGVSVGSCWAEDDDVGECAQSVLRDAADAWKRRFEPQPWPRGSDRRVEPRRPPE